MTNEIERMIRASASQMGQSDLLKLYDLLLHGGKREFLELKSHLRTCLMKDETMGLSVWDRMRAADCIRSALSSLPVAMMAQNVTVPSKTLERIRSLCHSLTIIHDRLLLLFNEEARLRLPPIVKWKRHGYNLTLLLKALIGTGCVLSPDGGRILEQDFMRLIGHAVGMDLSVSTIKNSRQYIISHGKDPGSFFMELARWCEDWMDEHLVHGRYQRRGHS